MDQQFSFEQGTLLVVSIVVKSKNKYLLLKRSSSTVNPGEWIFPGGKVSQGEHPETAIKRELKEETSIDLQQNAQTPLLLNRFLVNNGEIEYGLLLYICKVNLQKSDLISLNPREHQDYAWLTLTQIMNKDLMPAQRKIIKCLMGTYREQNLSDNQIKIANFRRIMLGPIKTSIYRSSAPKLTDFPSAKSFNKIGIHTLIDLRTNCEVPEHEIKAWKNIRISLPMGSSELVSKIRKLLENEDLSISQAQVMMYTFLKNLSSPSKLETMLNMVKSSLSSGGVLIFCNAGKDRTGVATMYIKNNFDCPLSEIERDYLRSGACLNSKDIPANLEPFARVDKEYFRLLYSNYIWDHPRNER